MRHKRNIFSRHLLIPVLSGLFWTCQMDKKVEPPTAQLPPAPPTPTLLAIMDGDAVFTDSTFVRIPHYGDTEYTIFYCVRHAEKRMDQGNNPSLTPEGEARATRLGKIMAQVRLDKACSTSFKRTVQTAEAIRKEMAEPPSAETYPPDLQDGWLDAKLSEGKGKRYLVVGHQNTIPQLLNRLKGSKVYPDMPDDEHGLLYVAITKGIGQTEVLELRY